MYKIKEVEEYVLQDIYNKDIDITIFQTYEWIHFLVKNQYIKPIILQLSQGDEVHAYFVGGIIKKIGIRILASPFEGWLSCDMGFINIKGIEYISACKDIAEYAFKYLKCQYVQITDKNIKKDDIDGKLKYYTDKLLSIKINCEEDDIIKDFKSHGRRDVRASGRKGTVVEKVKFDKDFVEKYYLQLEDVFAKQNLRPFYSKEKLLDLVEVFSERQEWVLALECNDPDGKCIATMFSFGINSWAYYMGAASHREYQKYLPNERLFWEFLKFWNDKNISKIDLVGYREYKLKYNPKVEDIPVIYFEKYPGIFASKNWAKKVITLVRKVRGNK